MYLAKLTRNVSHVANGFRYTPVKCVIVFFARKWISQQYGDVVLCKMTADKGYGPALVSSATIASQHAKDLSSPAHVAVSLQDYRVLAIS